MAALTGHGIATGDYNPLEQEINRIVHPVAQTYEQAVKYKSMLTLLFSDQQTYELLYDFAKRYWAATHPVELTQMAASAVADIVVTVILAIVTAGVGAAASVISKSGRLVKVAELLEKITAVLRRIGPRTGLLEKGEEAAAKMGRAEKRIAKAVKEVREAEADVKKTERAAKLEKEAREGYDAAKATDGPKTTGPEEIIRRDNNPYDSIGRSGKKSHIDKNGDLFPANPKGKATVEQHIRGAEPAKSDSPYTSFSADSNTPKSYGNKKITVDSQRLKKDIDSGKLKDVEMVDQESIGGKLQKKIDEAQAKYDSNPSKKNAKLLERRKMDLKNTQRDKEILIKGKVPKKYIKITDD